MSHLCPNHGLPSLGHSECYAGLKAAAVNGSRHTLSPAELAFVGFGPPRKRAPEWHNPSAWALALLESSVAQEQDAAMYAALLAAEWTS
jgi:hypothetical protein